MSTSKYIEAQNKRNQLDKNLKRLRAELAMFIGDVTPEYTAAKERTLAAFKERDEFNKVFNVAFKNEIEAERLAKTRRHDRNRDLRFTSSVAQKYLFDQLNHQPHNSDRDRRQAKLAFSASGLCVGQGVIIWRRPVIVLAPVSRSQVRILNKGTGVHPKDFESFDRYDAIEEANHTAIEAALERDNAPPRPSPAPEPKPPVAAPQAEPAPMLNLETPDQVAHADSP